MTWIPVLDGKGSPGLIYPDDYGAQKQDDGSWKCGKCILEDIQKKIVQVIPESDRAKQIIKAEEDKVTSWNEYCKQNERTK